MSWFGIATVRGGCSCKRLAELKLTPHQIFVGCISAVSIAAFAACVGLVIVLV